MSRTPDAAAPLRVTVLGARGRMGQEVVRAVESADDLVLAGAYDADDELAVVVVADSVEAAGSVSSATRAKQDQSFPSVPRPWTGFDILFQSRRPAECLRRRRLE